MKQLSLTYSQLAELAPLRRQAKARGNGCVIAAELLDGRFDCYLIPPALASSVRRVVSDYRQRQSEEAYPVSRLGRARAAQTNAEKTNKQL
jgi:hypothetical protein